MSCFESSTFLKNPTVMNRDLLVQACEELGWTYVQKGEELLVTDLNNGTSLYGEYAIKVKGNTVTYNSYYLKGGNQFVDELRTELFKLNVTYARRAILQAFEAKGFKIKKDWDFQANAEVADQFFMVGYSKLKQETEKRVQIKFSILTDGTIVSDSNYIPEDVHELADQAMAELDASFGTQRREGHEIKRKPIPTKYKDKAYCAVNNKIKAKY